MLTPGSAETETTQYLRGEANELVAILMTSQLTAKKRLEREKRDRKTRRRREGNS